VSSPVARALLPAGSSARATGEDTRETDEEDQMSTKRGVSCESCSEYSENNDAAPTGFTASIGALRLMNNCRFQYQAK